MDAWETPTIDFPMKRSIPAIVACCLGLLAFILSAQTRKEAEGKTRFFKNVRLIDGTGKAPGDNVDIIVRGDKIQSISPTGTGEPPKESEVIDIAGKTIMPALIAAHSHLGLVKGAKAASANVTEDNVRRQLKLYAKYGIGTVVSLGADGPFIYNLREEQATSTTGPRVFTAGLGFGVANGAPPAAAGLDQVHRPATAEEARAQLNELAKLRPDFVKIWIDDFNGTMPVKMSREIRRTIIAEAHRHGLRVAAHVYYLSDARELVADGIDILAHSIRDLPVDDKLIAEMKEKGTSYIATLFLDEAFFAYEGEPEWTKDDFFKKAVEPGAEDLLKPGVFKPKDGAKDTLARASENLKRLHEGGVRIGMGTDSGASPYRVQGFAEHRELQLMVAAGFTPLEAIRSATLGNAEILNISDRAGTLQPGKAADFIVLGGDPLEDIRNTGKIEAVWLRGNLQD